MGLHVFDHGAHHEPGPLWEDKDPFQLVGGQDDRGERQQRGLQFVGDLGNGGRREQRHRSHQCVDLILGDELAPILRGFGWISLVFVENELDRLAADRFRHQLECVAVGDAKRRARTPRPHGDANGDLLRSGSGRERHCQRQSNEMFVGHELPQVGG